MASVVFSWGQHFSNKIDLNHYNKILDIGCRQGQISQYLAKQYPRSQFMAIDNIKDAIDRAKRNFIYSNLTFETLDGLHLEFTEHFDAVISFSCLHWIQDKNKIIQNIYQALKPGGKAYLQFFALHGRLKNDYFLYQIAQQTKWKNYFSKFIPDYKEITASECCSLLQNNGFIIHKLEFHKHQTNFEHRDELHQWLGTWASHKNRLPIKKQDYFLNETVQLYLNSHRYSENDPFPYCEYLLEVVCEKPYHSITSEARYQFSNIIFTPHEAFVIKHFLLGKTAKEIAVLKSVSSKTIEFHLAKIKEKINCYQRSDIFEAAYQLGFSRLVYDPSL